MTSSDTYYIIVTVIFGVFIIVMLWFLYKYMKKPNLLEMKHEELTDDQKNMLYKFCAEAKKHRLADEEKKLELSKQKPKK
jgi:hypothetical protein